MWEIFKPLEWAVSYVFYGIHEFLTLIGFAKGAGPAWILSIILLTVLVRVCMLPLFVKTLHSTRKLQAIQPEIKAIQKKYKGKKDQASKQALTQETMAVYQKAGANPFGSCLPLLVQSPFFIALFTMLRTMQDVANGNAAEYGPITRDVAGQIESTSFFGIKLSDTFGTAGSLGAQITLGVMIFIMCAVMFISQRIVMLKNMPIAAKEGPQFQAQKTMVYVFPVMYIFSGVIFPTGLLVYMMTTNIWTLLQGIWQIKIMPTPGSEAAEKKDLKEEEKREAEKELLKTIDPKEYEILYGQPDEKKQQRKQPSKKKKK